MFEKVSQALKKFSPMNTAPLQNALLDMAAEIDKLRAEIEVLKKQ